jgi:hypothetical protein
MKSPSGLHGGCTNTWLQPVMYSTRPVASPAKPVIESFTFCPSFICIGIPLWVKVALTKAVLSKLFIFVVKIIAVSTALYVALLIATRAASRAPALVVIVVIAHAGVAIKPVAVASALPLPTNRARAAYAIEALGG